MQPEPQPLAQEDFLHAINRCVQAYLDVKAKLPKDASYSATCDNHENACAAYLSKLPILWDPASFQLYIACIAHGAALGVIDPLDVGRFCHVAQTAISAWKLANLTVPAKARKNEKAAQEKATPLPPKGNQPEDNGVDQAIQDALSRLPTFEVQKQHFQLLRSRGQLLPSDPELRDNPLAALHFCQAAEQILRQEALAGNPPPPQAVSQPAPDQQEQPKQAA